MSVFESIAWVTLAAFCLQQMKIVDVAGVLKDNGVNLPNVEQPAPSVTPTTAASPTASPSPSATISPLSSLSATPEATGVTP